MKRFRVEVTDGTTTVHYPCPDYQTAYQAWVQLRDHARPEVQFTLQRRVGVQWVDLADPEPPTGGAA